MILRECKGGVDLFGLEKNMVLLYQVDLVFWKKVFENEKVLLSEILKDMYIAIEHVGSTAIPDILAKPIIDIAVGIKDISDTMAIISIMEEHGYVYRPGSEEKLLFTKGYQNTRTHHLHIEEYGKQCWINHVYFRNCLLENHDLRSEYVEIKKQLAEKYPNDREQYTTEKAAFIERVISLYHPEDKS